MSINRFTYIVFEEGNAFVTHYLLTIVYFKHEVLTCNDWPDINDSVGCSSVNTTTYQFLSIVFVFNGSQYIYLHSV